MRVCVRWCASRREAGTRRDGLAAALHPSLLSRSGRLREESGRASGEGARLHTRRKRTRALPGFLSSSLRAFTVYRLPRHRVESKRRVFAFVRDASVTPSTLERWPGCLLTCSVCARARNVARDRGCGGVRVRKEARGRLREEPPRRWVGGRGRRGRSAARASALACSFVSACHRKSESV